MNSKIRAFTLVELLVSVGIVSILVLLIFGGISKYREKANFAKCSGNLRQIGAAVSLYAGDHNGERPCAWSGIPFASTKVTSFGSHLWHVAALLTEPPKNATAMELRYAGDGYLPDSKVFYSPTQKSYQPDERGGFRQKNGSYEMGYIYYVVGEGLYNGDLLEQTANNRMVIPNRFPLVSTFGRDATLTLNAPRSTTDNINVLFTDGSVSQMTLMEAEDGLINAYSKDQLARLMLNLARKPLP